MDPIGNINIKKDSSFAMMLAAQKKGWNIFYIEMPDLFLEQGVAKARVRKLSVVRDSNNWFEFLSDETVNLDVLNAILMRKDPPVDAEFIYATHILERAANQGVLVVNRPQSLRDCNEKLYAIPVARGYRNGHSIYPHRVHDPPENQHPVSYR